MRIGWLAGMVCLSASAEKAAEWQVLADGVDASVVSCDKTGGFTGATIGFYAVTE